MQTLIFKLGIFVSSKICVLHCCMERQVMRSLYPKLLSTKVGCWYGSTEVPNLGLIPQQTLTAPQVGVFSSQLTHFSGSIWCQQDYRWSRCVVPALRFSWPVSWSGFLWGTVWEEYVPGQVERENNSWKLQVSRLLWKYCFFPRFHQRDSCLKLTSKGVRRVGLEIAWGYAGLVSKRTSKLDTNATSWQKTTSAKKCVTVAKLFSQQLRLHTLWLTRISPMVPHTHPLARTIRLTWGLPGELHPGLRWKGSNLSTSPMTWCTWFFWV